VDTLLVKTDLSTEDGTARWTVMAGPGTTSVQLPPLPAQMASFRPITVPASTTVFLLADDDAEGADAYRGFRRHMTDDAFGFEELMPQITA
jgi:hypothetical protein